MSLNFNNVPEQKQFKKGKFIRPGIQNLYLRDIQLQTSPNTGNYRPVFSMETEPIIEEGWEGFENNKGQIGNISGNFGYYLKDDLQQKEFVGNLVSILKAVGSYEDFMSEHGAKDFNELPLAVEAVKPYLVGKLGRYFVAAEQYQKLDGSGVGLKLKFPNRFFVESIESESKFKKFDENDPKHFKKLQKDETKIESLPF